MNYDLRDKNDRKRFLRYANSLMRKERKNVKLSDESNRTLNQNSYLHILCRILAMETGVTEKYAKDVYFKQLANPDIFVQEIEDPITHNKAVYLKSTAELTVTEMNRAINIFRHWSEDNGYYLPEATTDIDGTIVFATANDEDAFQRAEIETSKLDNYL